ncbi:MAG: DUF3267 domain-containing protein [Bacteroidota bacterium]
MDNADFTPGLIPGQFIAWVTFPGIIIHELAHVIFCLITRVPIHEVRFFHPFKTPPGYVLHGKPQYFVSTLLITIGPLLVNTLLAMGVFILAILSKEVKLLLFFLLWLGTVIGMHAFPSTTDASTLLDETNERIKSNFLVVLAYPIVLLIYIADFLSMVWFDAFYALGLLFLGGYLIGVSTFTLL